MKNKIKYITPLLLISGSLFTNPNKVNATLKNRVSGMLLYALGGNYGRGNYNLLDNVSVKSVHKKQVDKMVSNKILIGVHSNEFDSSNLKGIEANKYYHQSVDDKGNLVTLISNEKPKILDVNGYKVTTSYIDDNGQENKLIVNGLPMWLEGRDILVDRREKFIKNGGSSSLIDYVKFEEKTNEEIPSKPNAHFNLKDGLNVESYYEGNSESTKLLEKSPRSYGSSGNNELKTNGFYDDIIKVETSKEQLEAKSSTLIKGESAVSKNQDNKESLHAQIKKTLNTPAKKSWFKPEKKVNIFTITGNLDKK